MPALITHHLFGESAVSLLPEGIVSGQEELIAFLLGNQGPDPLFARFRTTVPKVKACHKLAEDMHQHSVLQSFIAFRDGVSHLMDVDKNIGRAFALGLAAHYVLDSTAHPLVFAQQHAICGAGVGLEDAPTEVHAVIESDIDSWLLWQERHLTVKEAPAWADLAHTDRITRVGGALFSLVAAQTYGIVLGADEYGRSVADYQRLYKAIDPAGCAGMRALGMVERLGRPHSQLCAMAHYCTTSDECASANLDHREWTSPRTLQTSTKSFPDLFQDALAKWPHVAEAVVRGDSNAFCRLSGRLNYDGMNDPAALSA